MSEFVLIMAAPTIHCHLIIISTNRLCYLYIVFAVLYTLNDNMKGLKNLRYLDLSMNGLEKLPEVVTSLIALQELYLNDTMMEFLPANFGRLVCLRILELRENQLLTLPKSISRLSNALQRIDIGQNEFSELVSLCGRRRSGSSSSSENDI